MQRLRRETEALVVDHLARGALVVGPAGSGKSSFARAIALCRYLHVVTPERARRFLRTLVADGAYRISTSSIPWFEELSLPGLAESVAEAQLFGFTRDVTPGADTRSRGRGPESTGRIGIFETAARGHAPPGHTQIPDGARATRGFVFLDEVGDVPLELQPKLLAVLTGTRVYRVGGEGREEYGFAFEGLTLAATWRDPAQTLRADLHARLTDHVLHVPSLSQRSEDLSMLCTTIVDEIKAEHARWSGRLLAARASNGLAELIDGFDGQRIASDEARMAAFVLDAKDMRHLQAIDWSAHGELRGLTQVLRRRVLGARLEEALSIVPRVALGSEAAPAQRLLGAILTLPAGQRTTLARAVAKIQKADRVALVDLIRNGVGARSRLGEKLGLDRRQMKQQIADLRRRANHGESGT